MMVLVGEMVLRKANLQHSNVQLPTSVGKNLDPNHIQQKRGLFFQAQG